MISAPVEYSTTRLLTNAPPVILVKTESEFQFLLRLPVDKSRRCEGGLRTRDLYKGSLPNKPLITVITVVFNGVATIKDTILSVLDQTYDNVEFIIIDGGSNDGTLEIIKEYEHVIDYWVSEKDQGIYDAMNKGIVLASGEYVGLLNSDDYFATPSALQHVAQGFETTSADVIFSVLDIVDRSSTKKILRHFRVAFFHPQLMRIGIVPPHPTLYCKRTVYERIGKYKTDYRVAADFEIMVRLFISAKVTWHFMDEVTVNMRAGGISNNGLFGRIHQNFEIIRACRENGFYTNIFLIAMKLPIKLLQAVSVWWHPIDRKNRKCTKQE